MFTVLSYLVHIVKDIIEKVTNLFISKVLPVFGVSVSLSKSSNKSERIHDHVKKIELACRGLKIFSVEILDNLSIFHGVHPRSIPHMRLGKIGNTLKMKLLNENIFISHEDNNHKLLKIVVHGKI